MFIKVSRLPSVSSVDEDEMWLTAKIVLLQRVRRSFFIEEIDYECTQGVQLIVDPFVSSRSVENSVDISFSREKLNGSILRSRELIKGG